VLMDGDAAPACWSWPLWPDGKVAMYYRRWPDAADSYVLSDWHAGRCAVCGEVPGRGRGAYVEDHDHATGWTRGWLCRSCNLLEAASVRPAFVRYRERPPAAILGISKRYVNAYGNTPLSPRVLLALRYPDKQAREDDLERAIMTLVVDN
jgi:hypothetical protein